MNFSNLPPLHPALVHFPIALVAVSFFCDLIGRLAKSNSLREAGWWCLLLGAIGTVLAIPLGYFDMKRAMLDPDTHEYVDLHERIGWVVLIAVVTLTVFRSLYRLHRERPIGGVYFLVALLATGLTLFQGWFGGEMVYAHGAGVAPTDQGTQTATDAKKPLEVVKNVLTRVPGLAEEAGPHHGSEIEESAGAASKTNPAHQH